MIIDELYLSYGILLDNCYLLWIAMSVVPVLIFQQQTTLGLSCNDKLEYIKTMVLPAFLQKLSQQICQTVC